MNSNFGLTDPYNTSAQDQQAARGISWAYGTGWRQWLKTTDIKRPSDVWLFVDEHPDGINDAFFIAGGVTAAGGAWGDWPAAYHNGACGFTFSDAHSEVHKWQLNSGLQKYYLGQTINGMSVPSQNASKRDGAWYDTRTRESTN